MSDTSDAPLRPSKAMPLAVVVLTAAVWLLVFFSPAIPQRLGLGNHGNFFDARGTLAAIEAASRGLDPYQTNPLDGLGRAHLYSSWWLALGKLGLTTRDAGWLATATVALVLAAAVAAWRIQTWRDATVAVGLLVSPAWVMAIYRANIDLLMFIGLALVLRCLQHERRSARMAGAILVGILGILKYFPAAAIIGILRAPKAREIVLLLAAFAAVIVAGWPSVVPALDAVANYGPNNQGLQAFGAPQMFRAVPAGIPPIVVLLICGAAAGVGYGLGNIRSVARKPGSEDRTLAAAVAGAVTICAFMLGTSHFYKLIFLWWLAGWLLDDGAEMLGGVRAWSLLLLLLTLSWTDGLLSLILNTFGPAWSVAQRGMALDVLHTAGVITQFGYWVLMGACARIAVGWSRARVALVSGGTWRSAIASMNTRQVPGY
jgi:hypothetical protein